MIPDTIAQQRAAEQDEMSRLNQECGFEGFELEAYNDSRKRLSIENSILEKKPVKNDKNWNDWTGWRRCNVCGKRCDKYQQIPLTRLHGCSAECLQKIRDIRRGGSTT